MKSLQQTFGRVWTAATGVLAFMIALAGLMALVVAGTVAQASMPLAQAQEVFFHDWIVWAGLLPLPGLPVWLGYLSFGLMVQLARQPLGVKTFGSWLAHMGVLLLIVSGLAAAVDSEFGYVIGAEGQTTRLWQGEPKDDTTPTTAWPVLGVLPFTVTVDDFDYAMHPGTDVPAYFASKVTITPDDGQPWQGRIEMNAPLRFAGYTLYQSSYVLPDDGPPVTVLAAVHDRTRTLPYVATLVLAVGLLVQGLIRYRMVGGMAVVVGAMVLGMGSVRADDWLREFGAVPVQHEGRVKPLLAVAEVVVPELRGDENHEDNVAVLARWMLGGEDMSEPLVVKGAAVQRVLKLPPRFDGVYSLGEVVVALQPLRAVVTKLSEAGNAKLAPVQVDLLRTAQRAEVMLTVMRTLDMVRVVFKPGEGLSKELGVSGEVDAAALLSVRDRLVDVSERMMRPRADEPLRREVFLLMERLQEVAPERPNGLLRLVPPGEKGGAWLSVWQAAQPGVLSAEQQRSVELWRAAVKEYGSGGVKGETLRELRAVDGVAGRPIATRLETLWVKYSPITWSFPLLMAGLVFFWRGRRKQGAMLALAGWGLLGVGMLMRVVILARPPVATLYESVLFVAWAVVGAALLFGRKNQGLWAGGVATGAVLVMVAHGLARGQDTMGMLTAVLDTKLWLLVHVLTITGGYAASLLVAGAGAWGLVQRVMLGELKQRQATLRVTRALTVWALLLTAAGTMLGGVWASQSWGRFWGWDPKENGALVIVLWLAILLHMGYLRPVPQRFILVGSLLTCVVVALSWFGVNLLNVGLHSYGFTSGLGEGLALFCAAVGSMVIGLVIFDRVKADRA